MRIIAEAHVKKDSRNRVTLPQATYDYYRVAVFEDGHIELFPQVLTEPLVSARTLGMMDASIEHFARGEAGPVLDLADGDEVVDAAARPDRETD